MNEITFAFTALKTALELAKAGLEARDDAKIKAGIGEMAAKLADANMGALAMSEHLRAIEAELRDTTAKLRDVEKVVKKRERYVLHQVRKGAYVYAFEPINGDATPAHYQCQICFDSGKDSVLAESLNGNTLHCRIDRTHSIVLRADKIDFDSFG